MDITIDNDGKGKWQSFTASVDLALPHSWYSKYEAYGATEKEATDNLIKELGEIVSDINSKYSQLTRT